LSDSRPLRLAILWHMHQPDYQEPHTNEMVMPWVRLHAVKDYLDMPLMSARFENVRTTFNLVPSLLDQLEAYTDGATDPHLELSRINAEQLTDLQRREILSSFFAANPANMIRPFPRYNELYRKVKSGSDKDIVPALFTSSEMRDLQVWSNLVWTDPMFRDEEPIQSLFAKGKNFSEEDKQRLLDWQFDLIKRVAATYVELFQEGRIDVSFTPYYHPILPLLCDTDVAREALPKIDLPQRRFRHPEDAEKQIEMSMRKFEALFGRKMVGMWPSEGSVSEEVAEICIRKGIRWIATDEDILLNSLTKSRLERKANPLHTVYEYGPGIKILFRDRALSDRIGFVYSGWPADRAVADFVSHLKNLRRLLLDRIDEVVVPVILDGENAWEYFPNDGREFLQTFYQALDSDPELQTVTVTEAVDTVKSRPLSALFAGSWINHDFRIWIGHAEDNAAWDLLSKTREALVTFEREHPDYDSAAIAKAWNQVYKAEGSDWCWWYGDEHRGPHNQKFDGIYRSHLIAVYELLGLEAPLELLNPIYQSGAGLKAVLPEALLTPEIDGRLTHFYEWTGSGYFDCLKAGGSMHRMERHISAVYFAYDHDRVYIRLDMADKKAIELLNKSRLLITFFTPERLEIELHPGKDEKPGESTKGYHYCLRDTLEFAVDRQVLWPNGFGTLGFTVTLYEGDERIESWPENEPIRFEVAQKDRELFWPS
jgi:alpha-amylase/alpha-mannosidase (GH57 family)